MNRPDTTTSLRLAPRVAARGALRFASGIAPLRGADD